MCSGENSVMFLYFQFLMTSYAISGKSIQKKGEINLLITNHILNNRKDISVLLIIVLDTVKIRFFFFRRQPSSSQRFVKQDVGVQ